MQLGRYRSLPLICAFFPVFLTPPLRPGLDSLFSKSVVEAIMMNKFRLMGCLSNRPRMLLLALPPPPVVKMITAVKSKDSCHGPKRSFASARKAVMRIRLHTTLGPT
ncbi:hypothetical protein BKA81DRAFT_41670 [Phyllosticta paracitricarpa]